MTDIFASEWQGDAVAQLLDDDERKWWTPTAHDALERSEILRRFDSIKDANVAVLGVNSPEAALMLQDYDQSVAFVHDSFDAFESTTPSETQFDSAFLVPARGRHASEVTDFLPILDTEYGASPSQVHRTVAHLAPTVIETYRGTEDVSGALVYVPAYFDMNRSGGNAQMYQELLAAQRRVSEAAHFVRQRHRVGLAGLGAVLPGVTQQGNKIKEEGLVTTTGHGGTVHLISQAVEQAIELMSREPRIGVFGLGAIGGSSLDVLRNSHLKASIRSFRLYDVDDTAVYRNARTESKIPTYKARSDREVLERSDIIVAAATAIIDLDYIEQRDGRPLNLAGKIIVDDSQPGCFDREQVEARGGKLVWVVGSDQSDSGFLHRNNGYTYGNETGLYGDDAVWGCEAEVASLALLGKPELAVKTKVNPQIAREIGKICFDAGIRAAWPPQSFGRPVEF